MNRAEIKKPEINPKLTYGAITSFRCQDGVTMEHGKYRFHLYLTFEYHPEPLTIQRGGFKKKTTALKAKELAIAQLHDGIFVPWDFQAKEVYDFWLYYYMMDKTFCPEQKKVITYNTYLSYRNIIYNYLLPCIGETTKLSKIQHETIISLAKELFPKKSLFSLLKGVLHNSFTFMKSKNLIGCNPIPTVFRVLEGEQKQEHLAQNKTGTFQKKEKSFHVMSAQQAAYLLYHCKLHEFSRHLYMPLLFSLCCGLRIREAFAIKFHDILYREKSLLLCRQLGRRTDGEKTTESSIVAQEIPTKNKKNRTIPIADFVMEEIILAKKRYDILKENCPDFHDNGYITCYDNGNAIPITMDTVYSPYKRLFLECGFSEHIVWHDLRHTYASLLKSNSINLKAISEFMGHKTPEFTLEYYIKEYEPIIYDVSHALTDIIKDIFPELLTQPKEETNAMVTEAYFPEYFLLDILPETCIIENDSDCNQEDTSQ